MPRMKFTPRKCYFQLEAELSIRDLDLATGLLYQWGIATTRTHRARRGIFLSAELPDGFSFQGFRKNLRIWERGPAGRKLFKKLRRHQIRDRSWVEKYQKFLRPFILLPAGKSGHPGIRVDPRGRLPATRDPHTLYIQAGLAFGTGTHATTRMATEILAQVLTPKAAASVLDVGCGTGILAMAANKLGAKRIMAVDNDPEAIQVAQQNFSRNRIRGVALSKNLPELRRKFSVIVSNIGLNTLVELRQELIQRLTAKGRLILTGLLYKDRQELTRTYRGLRLVRIENRLGWSAFLFEKPFP